jgi:hypothetical protein
MNVVLSRLPTDSSRVNRQTLRQRGGGGGCEKQGQVVAQQLPATASNTGMAFVSLPQLLIELLSDARLPATRHQRSRIILTATKQNSDEKQISIHGGGAYLYYLDSGPNLIANLYVALQL